MFRSIKDALGYLEESILSSMHSESNWMYYEWCYYYYYYCIYYHNWKSRFKVGSVSRIGYWPSPLWTAVMLNLQGMLTNLVLHKHTIKVRERNNEPYRLERYIKWESNHHPWVMPSRQSQTTIPKSSYLKWESNHQPWVILSHQKGVIEFVKERFQLSCGLKSYNFHLFPQI